MKRHGKGPATRPVHRRQARAAISAAADSAFGSPVRNLAIATAFVAVVFGAATLGYLRAGWSLGDAAYMVVTTIFSVGYNEVRPIDTLYLRALTTATIVLGCTGMIVLTGALVQAFTVVQIRRFLGPERMQTQIDRLEGHAVICGFGRIGMQLATHLQAAGAAFVIVDRNPAKVAEAQAQGYLCVTADAIDESALEAARIRAARVLATVLPDDASNVFITLSARNLNPALEIIARGEAPTTESKLYHAGASRVVLPTHTGAERIAEMILYPATERVLEDSAQIRDVKRGLREFGLEIEGVTVPADGVVVGWTVRDAELRGEGAFFVVQIDRASGQSILNPGPDVPIEAADRLLLVLRGSRVAAAAVFSRARAPGRPRRNQA